MLRNILHFSHLSLSDCLLHVAHVRVFSRSMFILGKQVRCNEHRKRSLNVTFFTFLRLGCDSKLMNESHKKVQVVVIVNHGTKGPCPHTGDGDTGAQWPVVAIQRVWCRPWCDEGGPGSGAKLRLVTTLYCITQPLSPCHLQSAPGPLAYGPHLTTPPLIGTGLRVEAGDTRLLPPAAV